MDRFTRFSVRSPSNIALIKYWGKRPGQLPCNPSLSMTLTHAYTQSTLSAKRTGRESFRFLLEGRERAGFDLKASELHKVIAAEFPVLREWEIEVDSKNTFPHATGIASSASGMSALALALLELAEVKDERTISRFARLGSGSACRSVYPGLALWGESELIAGSSDDYAVPFTDFHANFKDMHDTIVIVSDEEKSVSSSAGHDLMNTHPYGARRFEVARLNLAELLGALKEGDWRGFSSVVEREALELHSMMMTGTPSYTLMLPQTLDFIIRFRAWRDEQQVEAAFTLDAGPNIHVLSSAREHARVNDWINSLITEGNLQARTLQDQMGVGAQLLKGSHE